MKMIPSAYVTYFVFVFGLKKTVSESYITSFSSLPLLNREHLVMEIAC